MAKRRPTEAQIRSHLDDDEVLVGSFVGWRGPRLGVEVLAVMPAAFLMMATGWRWLLYPVIAVTGSSVAARRRYATVVLTDRNVVVIDLGRRRKLTSKALASRLPSDAIGVLEDSIEARVAVGLDWFWVMGDERDAAYRLARRTETTGS